ncbi:MAG: low specificity L-threonine aldolase [Verrucomicrobiota bacterium]
MNKDQQFASDNYSGICPEALEAIIAANEGHHSSYGDDRWTEEACDLFRELFETDLEAFFVFNGTAGNSLALATLCESYHSIICQEFAHIETDECGAPEFFSHGAKILLGKGDDGKLTPASIEELVSKRSDIHYPKPRVVSLTQATELGGVYDPDQLMAIRRTVKKHNLKWHMDGARFANAVASLGVKHRQIANDCGVDVLVLGGSKNGLAVGEAVLFFDKSLGEEFAYRCKQAGQLASKMRFMSAQWVGILKSEAWMRNAEHANRCAAQLEEELSRIEELKILFPREANGLFLEMPPELIEFLHGKGWKFYTFIGSQGARLMCSWNTREETIRDFVDDVKAGLAS